VSEGPVRLKYHQATFDMLGETPAVSAAALAKITAWERRHRAKLPGSLREWYSLETAGREWTYEPVDKWWFTPAPLEELLQRIAWQRRRRKGKRSLSLEICRLEDERADYAHLDGSEDPLVYGPEDDSPMGTFSEFLFHRLWEALPEFRPVVKRFSLAATEPAFSGMELDFLTDHFQEGPREVAFQGKCEMINPFTGQPMKTYPFRFYFFHPGGRVRVCCQADPARAETEADWRIDAPSKKELVQTVTRVWPCGTLSQTLTSETRQGKAVLKEFRSRS
jgi:hypothetical protein